MDTSISTPLLARLVATCQELSHARDMDMVMAVVRRAARELTGADGATFVLLDRRSEGDYCYYADEDAIGPLWKGSRFPVRSCISGWAMLNKATAVVPDIYADPRIPVDLYEPTFVRSLVMAPIRKSDPLGAIGTYWKEGREPTEEEVRFLEALTDITAVTIELVGVYRDLERRVEERTLELLKRTEERTANIEYARRVQAAMLPAPEKMEELLPEHFVLSRPKDLVSGDFYWLAQRQDKVLFAVADCTGHGVTGALLSAMCSHQLDRAVNEFGFTDPGLVLDMTRELVWDRLSKHSGMADGMDISLCTIERSSGRVSWSGANSDLWHITQDEVRVIKAHKQSVGRTRYRSRFPTHTLAMHPGDRLYLMTDGFADQFGGPWGKKFKSKPLRELLLRLHQRPMAEQKQLLAATFEAWKGDLEQVDDVTLVGIGL